MELLDLTNLMKFGAMFLAVIMAATEFFKWPRKLHYIWAVIVFVWGLFAL